MKYMSYNSLSALVEVIKEKLSAITSQITSVDNKITKGGASTLAGTNLTANRALVSNSSGKVGVSAVTSTELGYLDGVTSAIQTQLNGKAATNHTHPYAGSSSAGGAATSAVKLATARTIRTNLGSTSVASFDGSNNVTPGVTGTLAIANGGTGATSAAAARTALGAAASSHVHSASQVTGLTASRVLVSNSSGAVSSSGVTTSDLLYVTKIFDEIGVSNGVLNLTPEILIDEQS